MIKQDTKTQAVRCSYLDLMGVLEAFDNGDPWQIDLKSVSLTLDELWQAFPEELADLGVER